MPAFTRRWQKVRDTSSEQSFECRPYGTEVVQAELDTSELQQQMRHANEQLAISSTYPGRDRPQPLHRVRLRAVK